MSYTPNTWQTGDTITAAKLNNMEQGIANAGGGILVVHDSNGILDKTWQEIYDAKFSILHDSSGGQNLQIYCGNDEGSYVASYWTFGLADPITFVASSSTDYPELSQTDYPELSQ